jgi:endonuclease/exonuclease/phosphatase family metal-dependent hydrolase
MADFKVMSWNVENLVKPKTARGDQAKLFDQKLALLAKVIRQLAPDVVGLQEVGGQESLAALQKALDGAYPHASASGIPDRRGIRVAFLSRWPILEQEDLADFPPGPALMISDASGKEGLIRPVTRMGRGALRIRLRVGAAAKGFTTDVINVHLKSKLLSFSRPGGGTSFQPKDETERVQVAGMAVHRRTAEAVTVRTYLNTLLAVPKPSPVILLGDFNDVPEAQTSLILNGPPGSEIGTQGFDREDESDRYRLFNLAPLIETPRRYSRIYRGKGELLDQIFASADFFPIVAGRRRLPQVDSHIDIVQKLPSIGEDPGDRAAAIAPDHAPVTAAFEL